MKSKKSSKAARVTGKNSPTSVVYQELFPRELTKGELVRLRLLDVATKIIGQHGITHLTYEALGKPLGMPRSHVAYYFKSIEEVTLAVFRKFIANGQRITIQAIQSGGQSPLEQLRGMVHGTFAWIRDFGMEARCYVWASYAATHDPTYKKMMTQVRHTGRDRVIQLVHEHGLAPQKAQSVGSAAHQILSMNALDFIILNETYSAASTKDIEVKTWNDMMELIKIHS